MKKLKLVLIFLVILTTITTITTSQITAQTGINSGKDVILAMHQMYEGKWYKNVTFEQETTFYGPGEEVQQTQVWYEAIKIPGRLAIKFEDINGDNGIIFNAGVQFGFADGEKIQEKEQVLDLLVLGFDVYGQSPDTTFQQLEMAGYDLDLWYEDEWAGRAAYVVGTDQPSPVSPQFWIDKERLYFVRNITTGRQNTLQEVQLNKFEKLDGGWIASEVIFYVNGQKGLLEEYSNIETHETLSDDLFNPDTFVKSSW